MFRLTVKPPFGTNGRREFLLTLLLVLVLLRTVIKILGILSYCV